jgi:propionyl-CoA synthetase
LIDKSGFLTYKQLLSRVSRAAGVLKNLGIQKGDNILFFMPNIQEHHILTLAAARIGAVTASCTVGFGVQQLALRMQAIKPALVVTASCEVDSSGIKD